MTTRSGSRLPQAVPVAKRERGGEKSDAADSTPWQMGQEDWNRRYATRDFIWTVHVNDCLAREVASLAPGRALDLAAGEGRNAVWLAVQGWSVVAVDYAQLALDKGARLAASHKVADRIDFRLVDLNRFVPAAQGFDLVTLVYLQLPWAELAPILRRAAGAVAAGGTLLLIAHHSQNLRHGYGGPRHPEVLYRAEQVVALLADDLVIEKAEQVERPVNTADGVKLAIDCLVRARCG